MTAKENWTFLTGKLNYLLGQMKEGKRHEVEYLVHKDNLDALKSSYGVTTLELKKEKGEVSLYRFVLESSK